MENTVTLPKWNDPALKAGTMVRTALWLISEVGVGNSFTKEKHRAAFSGISQADRRMRDLRKFGWVIHTSTEDVTLKSNEQRLVAVGYPVWEGDRRKTVLKDHITAKVRMATFAQSDYQCSICGIAGGEHYPDAPGMTAVLGISRRKVTLPDGQVHTMFVPECNRCSSGTKGETADVPQLLTGISSLDPAERALFALWAESGRLSQLDNLWSQFRRLPAAAQDQMRQLFKQKPSK
jgi:hypothetical protein